MKLFLLPLIGWPVLAQVTFPPDLTVSRLELVQTVQDENQQVPLIAGKATAARVFVRQLNRPDALISGVTVFLRAFRNGIELAQSPQRPVTAPVQASLEPDRNNPQHAVVFILPANWTTAGDLELRAELRVPPGVVESPTDNNSLRMITRFQPPPVAEARISWLKVCVSEDCYRQDAAWQRLVERLLPVAEASLHYDDVPAPPVVWNHSLSDPAGISAFEAHLKKWKYLLEDSPSPPQVLVAWLPRSAQAELGAEKVAGGLASGAAWVVEQTSEVANQNALARAVGRALGLAPAEGGCAATTGQPGFDPIGTRFLPPTRPSFLASCDDPLASAWIRPAEAIQLWESFRPASPSASSDYVLVTGTSSSIDSVMVVRSSFAPEPSTSGGETCVRVVGSEGENERCFSLEETLSFATKLRLPGRLVRIVLRRSGLDVASLEPSGVSPRVAIENVQEGESWSGMRTLRWSASDAGNRPLKYTLFYSNDEGQHWYPLTVDTSQTSVEIDTAVLLGPSIQFRLVATAGADQATAHSPTLRLVQSPSVELSPSSIDFGNVVAGMVVERVLAVSNSGSGPFVISQVQGLSEPFELATPLPFRVRAGLRRPLPLRHRARMPGVDALEAALVTNDPVEGDRAVRLRAAVFDQAVPSAILTPNFLDFGSVAVGQSRDLTVRLRNEGFAPLLVSQLATQNARFAVISPLGSFTLLAGQERMLVIRFTPLGDGAQLGALNVATNDPTNPTLRAELRGFGQLLANPRLELSPTSLDFGAVALGQHRALALTIRNAGNGPLTVSRIAVTNTAAYAVISPAAPVSIAPGGQQVVSVRFQPTALGPQTGQLILETNDPGQSRVSVPLQGSGLPAVAMPPPRISYLTPASMQPVATRFDLTVVGANFQPSSVVHFNGAPRPTAFVSSSVLRASLAPEDVASARVAQISVLSAPPGGSVSNSVPLVVNDPGPTARIPFLNLSLCPSVQAETTIVDRIGAPVTALNASNLRCSEDGVSVPCTVVPAEASGSGLSWVMVLHASAGVLDPVKQRSDLLAMRNAALAFVDAIGLEDRLAITQMDNGVRLLRDFTAGENRNALQDAVNSMRAPLGIGTSLYDAIEDGLDRLATQGNRRKAMLIFAGNENTFDTRPPRDVAALLTRVQNAGVALNFMPLGDGFRNLVLLSIANQLALDSGGVLFTDPAISAVTQVTRLAESMRQQQIIHYTTPHRDGQPHLFRVDFTIPGATFTAARGYAGCRP
ncbi:MAG: choice-of-anchor D domain-containing protein [Bryobacteraceae bacterium]|nr:choice-of-anchor D domain-containing protein [Bryobacteraceae bacterium]MDW8377485.1 choice-of-anchor D domain-containing protein [Bryobacterales bacterium]